METPIRTALTVSAWWGGLAYERGGDARRLAPDFVVIQGVLGKTPSYVAVREGLVKVAREEYKNTYSGRFRLVNTDLDLKIWIFGFPIEHKI